MDILATALREEALKRAVDRLMELVTEARGVTPGGKSLRDLSEYATRIRSLLQELRLRRVEATTESDVLRAALQRLEAPVSKACEVIRSYKSGSRLRLLLNSRSMVEQLQDSATDIARAVQLLDLGNLVTAFDLKSKADEIVRGLESLEFKSAIATEAIVSDLEKSITNNGRSWDYNKRLLQQIAEAVGARPVDEIALLKREIEELEERKQHAEALQLSQLMQLLYSSEMVPGPIQEATPASTSSQSVSVSVSVISSFTCPLSGRVMEDPVAILCGHSFERHSIMEHFGRGDRRCPTCKEELPSLELTRNISLRNSIQEWKQRTAQHKLQSALSSLSSDDPDVLNQALEDLCFAMETTDSINKDTEQRELVLKLVALLKNKAVNTKPALKCLCNLARCSDENKEVIADNGAIRCIVKQFCRGETEPEAIEVLLELSQNEVLAEQIGNTKDSIPTLVSLLQNQNPEISQKAGNVLGNLSFNTHFVIRMAEARHFKPFLACFHKGRSETRASMATALTRMLSESTAKHFEDEQFISALTKTLYSNSPASKSACLRCIRRLTAFHILVRRFLADRDTIPALLGLISISSETHWKQEATEILISLVRASQPLDYQTNPSLQELHSEHNIHVFLQLASASTPQTKVSLLGLLLAMVEKSEIARDLIRSDANATACLFSNLQGDYQSEVRLHAMKLIYCVAEEHPAGIPLPPSPAKESIVIALATIFTSSPNNEERAAAAGIIGRLPSDDTVVNDMLKKPEALKAIHEVISAADDRHWGMTKEPSPTTTTPSYLLENALAALLQYTEPTKPELQRQVARLELYPSLVRVLSTGSPLAKQRTALVLARLSQATQLNITTAANTDEQMPNLVPLLWLTRLFHIKSWCCPSSPLQQSLCSVHGSGCSARYAFCLIKADAVRPLVQTLSEKECGASEAALMALDTLFVDDRTHSSAATAIVESHGADAILEVLEKGSQSAKEKAFDLFPKIFKHPAIGDRELQRSKSILIHLLQDEALKRKAAVVLSKMDFIPQQSSYF